LGPGLSASSGVTVQGPLPRQAVQPHPTHRQPQGQLGTTRRRAVPPRGGLARALSVREVLGDAWPRVSHWPSPAHRSRESRQRMRRYGRPLPASFPWLCPRGRGLLRRGRVRRARRCWLMIQVAGGRSRRCTKPVVWIGSHRPASGRRIRAWSCEGHRGGVQHAEQVDRRQREANSTRFGALKQGALSVGLQTDHSVCLSPCPAN
jgi:hypothetical protein